MTIPPIGSHISPVIPPEESQDGNNVKGAPSTDRSRPAERSGGPEVVELSPDARRVRDLQARITELQLVEHAADHIRNQARDVKDSLDRLEAGAKAGDRNRVEQAASRAEQSLKSIEATRADTTFDGRKVLSDETDESGLGKPQANREIDKFTAAARAAIRDKSGLRDEKLSSEMDRVAEAARKTRARLEHEVRDSVTRVVKESAKSTPCDTAAAEELIRRARENQTGTQQRPRNIEQISSRAVRLLE
jgi:hypothetical protein